MKSILIGFSTTGKSTLLETIKSIKPNNEINYIDSDRYISSDYNHHIYNMFLSNHNDSDPVNRKKILTLIAEKENAFIANLRKNTNYIAALGPNVHTRSQWSSFLKETKPKVVFLKANPELVYKGLIRREDNMPPKVQLDPAFGSWNQGVIRVFNSRSKRYKRLSKEEALLNINQLISINEDYYSSIAQYTFNASELMKVNNDYYNTKRLDEVVDILLKE